MKSSPRETCKNGLLARAATALLIMFGQASAKAEEGVVVSHSAPLYTPGVSLEVTCTFVAPAGHSLQSLLWTPTLPAGFALVPGSVSGDGGPEVDSEGAFAFLGDLSASPLRFRYEVAVPAGLTGAYALTGVAEYQLDGMVNPEPVAIPAARLADAAATHAARGYLAGHSLTVDCTFAYPAGRQLQSLLWTPELPPGWTLVGAAGQGSPEVDLDRGDLAFLGDLTANPLTFSYTVAVPSGTAGAKNVGGQIEYTMDGMLNPSEDRAQPDPLVVPEMHTVEIVSAFGASTPPAGLYTNFNGVALTNTCESPFIVGSRTLACSGWTLAGCEPAAGAGSRCVFALTNSAVLTWVWVAPLITPAGSAEASMDEDGSPRAWVQPEVISAATTSTPAGQPAGSLTWSLQTQAAHGVAAVSGAGPTPVIVYSPSANYYGPDSFVVRAEDGLGGADAIAVNVTVGAVNDAPVLAPIGDKRTDERTTLTFAVAATDVDVPAQALTYSLDAASRARGMAIDAASGVFSWTPSEGQAGADFAEFPVTVTVTDNGTSPGALSDSESFIVTLDSARATHAAVGYVAGRPLTVDCTFSYPAGRQLQSLLWKPELPEGWVLAGASGDGQPEEDPFDGSLVFSGGDLAAHNPVVFRYTVMVPAGTAGPQTVGGVIDYQMNGMFNPASVRAQPDPLVVPMLVSLPELLVSDKVYDGLTNATVVSYGALSGVLEAHSVQLVTAGAWSFFATPSAGSNKVVTVGGLALTGADASLYAIDVQAATASVAQATLTVGGSFEAPDKTYDGTVAATVSVNALTLVAPVAGDDVALQAAAAFGSKDVGDDKAVSLTGSTLTGGAKDNYVLSLEGSPTASADILFPPVSGSQACAGFRSPSSGTVVTCSFTAPAGDALVSLVWRPALPAGWTLVSASGGGAPALSGGDAITFAGPFTQSTVSFTFTVQIPGNQVVTNYLNASAEFQLASMADALTASRLPATLLLKRYHSADYRAPYWRLDPIEVNRVKNYATAGAYHVDEASFDGFNSLSGNTDGGRHSADFRTPFWRIDPTELNRRHDASTHGV